MALFGSLLGAGVSALGGLLGARETEQGQTANQGFQRQFSTFPGATPGLNVTGPAGGVSFDGGINQSLSPELAQQFGMFSGLSGQAGQFGPQSGQVGLLSRLLLAERGRSRGGLERRRLQTLRNRSRPFEDELRRNTRAQVFNRGRLGLGTSGTVTGLMSNPELASLEEGLARADLARQESATQFARQRRADRIGEVSGMLGQLAGVGSQGLQNQFAAAQASRGALQPAFTQTALGIQGRTPLQNLIASQTGQQTNPFPAAVQRARGVESFFAGLGGNIADSGLFAAGGGVPGTFGGNTGLTQFDPVTGDPIN